MRAGRGALLVGMALATFGARGAAAQGTPAADRCTLQIDNVDRQGIAVETPQGTNYFAGGNVRLRCRNSAITMRSDSVASYAGNVVEFIGDVRYRDSTLTMDADRGTYYRAAERWEARGHVKTQNLKTGSTLEGPSLDYYRTVQGVRDTTQLYAVSRPRIAYAAKDSAGAPAEPYIIVADRVRIKGDDQVWGGGKVTIDRSDFAARGDSLRLDTGKGSDGTLLGERPELHGLGADTFDLSGRRIDFKLKDRELTFVLAQHDSKAVNKDWTLVADTIALDVDHRKLERTRAWGDSLRPVATSPDHEIRADSLALDTPGQQLEEARAFRRAWLGGAVDSATKERDWLAGDTVVARFAPHDSAGQERTVLTRLVARDSARSYRVERDPKKPAERPSVSYARADEIVITLKPDGSDRADLVELHGHVHGAELEPSNDTSSAGAALGAPSASPVPADSAHPAPAAPADSTHPAPPPPPVPAAGDSAHSAPRKP
ncbi:MAG TPA: hypothetical protein VFW66_01745 [Gemmatimonadales bacterium]|nr:hypothetical protein [Gemmatimonadales bacterium]